nr:hypothetical protein Iba_chr14cCG2240 [Ipomoea batatas]
MCNLTRRHATGASWRRSGHSSVCLSRAHAVHSREQIIVYVIMKKIINGWPAVQAEDILAGEEGGKIGKEQYSDNHHASQANEIPAKDFRGCAVGPHFSAEDFQRSHVGDHIRRWEFSGGRHHHRRRKQQQRR